VPEGEAFVAASATHEEGRQLGVGARRILFIFIRHSTAAREPDEDLNVFGTV